ncbi:hypothetical protein HYC85_029886 [Camellia sinensis]|uniref:Uncharacterized protein n=1 Tax=Camellia sinensis TaxID=4442 RepID=A0A7J7FZZ7_CAMSI|nr:hypothetical protein HYC85_029886 [Camellia sinensis]
MEKQRNKPSYLPAVEGDSPAILAAFVLNALRFGDVNKILSNTSVFEHGGKYYSVAENYLAQEIDISSLSTLDDWDLGGAWGRPFTTHPKKAPRSGELVIMGVDAVKPYYVVGVISEQPPVACLIHDIWDSLVSPICDVFAFVQHNIGLPTFS